MVIYKHVIKVKFIPEYKSEPTVMDGIPNSFYVNLFRNSSMRIYPDNTIAAFTVRLAHNIDIKQYRWMGSGTANSHVLHLI